MTHQVAYVEWVDAGILASRWEDREVVVGESLRHIKGSIQTAGFVIANDDEGVVLALSFNPNNDDVNLAMFIPRANIREYRELQGG